MTTPPSRAALDPPGTGGAALLVLLLAACGGESSPSSERGADTATTQGNGSQSAMTSEQASGMQVLYEGEDDPASIALDDEYIYWASLDAIRRAPLSGEGAPVTLVTGRYIAASCSKESTSISPRARRPPGASSACGAPVASRNG